MGGLGFGQGYFAQYATGGTVPPDFPAIEDCIILVDADVEVVLVPEGTV
jgi:hypothetical protein